MGNEQRGWGSSYWLGSMGGRNVHGIQVVPLRGLLGTYGRLEVPSLDEGFDELYSVQIGADGGFVVEAVG
jgi:hypothetical protein